MKKLFEEMMLGGEIYFYSPETYDMIIRKHGSNWLMCIGCEHHTVEFWEKNHEEIFNKEYGVTEYPKREVEKRRKALIARIAFAKKLIEFLKKEEK